MIFQGMPPPRLYFSEAPLMYVAVALCLIAFLAASLRLHLLLNESRQHRIDLQRRGRRMKSIDSWMSMQFVLDPANYQPGTARPIIRRVLKCMAVQGLAAVMAYFIAFGFIL